jgi:hypothetical protein
MGSKSILLVLILNYSKNKNKYSKNNSFTIKFSIKFNLLQHSKKIIYNNFKKLAKINNIKQ